MKVSELMATNVYTCAPDDPLSVAAKVMWEHDCGVLPVVDRDRRVVGMITDRDICMSAYLRGEPLERCPVHSAMATAVVSCTADDTTENAQTLMRSHQVRRLPIVGSDGRLVGIVSLNDLALAAPSPSSQRQGMRSESVLATLAAISLHRTGATVGP